MKSSSFFILGYRQKNDDFIIGINKYNEVIEIGSFREGITENEKTLLIQTITNNKIKKTAGTIYTNPGICAEINFQAIDNGQLQNAEFIRFNFEIDWHQCTWQQLIIHNAPVEDELKFTNLDKVIWEGPLIHKDGLLSYLAEISPYMLPFLQNRILTVIRYPNGISGESFFQKNCPEYAPSFVTTVKKDDTDFVVCKDISTLLWLGNQLAIEYHIPFQAINEQQPLEIVFDLDPPSRDHFHLAIKAALELRISSMASTS